uniref:Docking protein 2 n=1 Tax=Nothobranchius furzeri TaxID=105023 RepID=A0A8C6PLB4_NOTFU
MEEDIRKQGMLFLQQQRFGKVRTFTINSYIVQSCRVHQVCVCVCVCLCVSVSLLSSLCDSCEQMSWMEAGAKRGTLQRGNKVDEDKGMEDNSLYSGQDRVRDFKVCIRRTDAADRCRLKGDGLLRADMEALHLMGKTGDVLYSWPYKYLRRFGRDKSTFSFEAGRRCNSGEGSFEFDTKQGNVLFQTVETAINLQKISLPHRQVSGGVPPEAADGVYSMVTEPQSPQMILHRDMDSSNPPQLSQLEPPADKVLTGVKSLTLDTRGLPVPRKNQVKMISSCPLPSASPEPGSNLTTGPSSNPTPRPKPSSKPEYSLPFDTIASSVMGDLLLASQHGLGLGGEAGADPLYDSIDEMKIRNIFKSPADSNSKVDHIYDEPEGCAIPSEEQKATPPPSVYDNPEEMRGGAWRCMGTTSDPTGHEYPYNPCVDDYAVPKRAQRAFVSQQKEEEEQYSTYDNVMVKMG